MSTFARRLAIPAGQTYVRFAHFSARQSTLLHDYSVEYRRALAAAAEYEALRRHARSGGPTLAVVARKVWHRHYA